jgi:hypothetical protein
MNFPNSKKLGKTSLKALLVQRRKQALKAFHWKKEMKPTT